MGKWRWVYDVAETAHVVVLEMLEQLELAISPFAKHGCAKRLHDLLDGDG